MSHPPRFHRLAVNDLRRESPDAVSLTFAIPLALANDYRFAVAPAPGDARVYVGFAAGSGITPILSIVKGVLAREPLGRLFLFYGNRSTGGMLFRGALEELKDRFMQRLSLFHVITGEEQDIPILHGRLDGEKVRVLLRSLVPAASVDHVFICGPTGMSE